MNRINEYVEHFADRNTSGFRLIVSSTSAKEMANAYNLLAATKRKSGYISNECNRLIFNVGVERFELPTPCSQSRCANRTALYTSIPIQSNKKGVGSE